MDDQMKRSTDVVIVGGGVIGGTIAYALRKRGVDVVVLDQGEIGAQASRAATGMLAPLKPFAKPDDPYTTLLLSSLARFPSLVAELEEASGINIEYARTGTLRVMHPRQLTRLQTWIAIWRQEGYLLELLTGDRSRACEPGLAPSVSLALYRPREPQLNASQLMKAYVRAAEQLGGSFYTCEEVIALNHHGNSITGVQTAQGHSIACGHLVLATGAWAGRCGGWLGLALPVQPLRAQSLAVRQPAIPIRHLLFGKGIYLAPKSNGTVIVGVARDEAGFAVQTTPEGVAWLASAAQQLVPALDTCAVEQAWAGLLPITPDARPLLGRALSWNNVSEIQKILERTYVCLLRRHLYPLDPSMKERAFTQIYNYFKQNRREMQQIIETEVDIMIEKDSYILTGRIDLLRESNGMLELLDFKTEARPPLDTIKLVDYERQLCTYAHALEWRYGRRPERLLLYWTQEALREDALMEIHYRPEVVEQVERSFTTVVNKIKGKDFRIITVPERKICAHCDMYHYCLNEGTIAPYVQAETMLSM